MADIYRIWLHIEKVTDPGFNEECQDMGEPEELEVTFESFEEATACRTMVLNLYDTMSTYIIKTYAPVYQRVEQLEELLDYHDWSWRMHEHTTSRREGGPTNSGSDLGQGGDGETGPGESPVFADPGAEGAGLPGPASGHPEAELTRRELDFLDAQAEDGPVR